MKAGPALFVARHAPATAQGLCYGQSDVATTLDAPAAYRRLLGEITSHDVRPDRVWTSPWLRTREPATLLASALAVPLAVDARLSELGFGEWEGRPYAELEADARFAAWMNDWREAAPPGGERLAQLVSRVRAWKQVVLARHEVALAVTHAGVVRVLRADARGVEYDASEAVDALKLERIF